jgi:hypothetical protein
MPGKGGRMRAVVGDKIVVERHHVGEPHREAEVLAVEGPDGAPPYRVRWAEDGHESLFFPGSDATVVHPDASQSHEKSQGSGTS